MPDGEVYEGQIDANGDIEVPVDEVGNTACVIDAAKGMVIDYVAVGDGGRIDVGATHAGTDVQVVIPDTE